MVEKSELLRVPAFADLPDDQIAWFINQSQELHLKAGDTYARQGDPADSMFVILEGRLQGRGELAGESVVFDLEPGDVTGVLPFSRMKQFTVGGRAVPQKPPAANSSKTGWLLWESSRPDLPMNSTIPPLPQNVPPPNCGTCWRKSGTRVSSWEGALSRPNRNQRSKNWKLLHPK